MRTSSTLLGVALLSAATSALVTLALRSEPVTAAADNRAFEPDARVTPQQFEALVREVDALRRSLEDRLGTPSDHSARQPLQGAAEAEPSGGPDPAQLIARVEALEAFIEEARGRRQLGRADARRGSEVPILDLQARALDPALDEAERVRLLGTLRGKQDELGNDARSPEVVLAMIDIAESTLDEALRANVWRQLDGSTEPALRDPLLRSLQLDPAANVRSEAAESLGHFASDPLVENALRFAATNDPDEDVRKEAQRSLHN